MGTRSGSPVRNHSNWFLLRSNRGSKIQVITLEKTPWKKQKGPKVSRPKGVCTDHTTVISTVRRVGHSPAISRRRTTRDAYTI